MTIVVGISISVGIGVQAYQSNLVYLNQHVFPSMLCSVLNSSKLLEIVEDPEIGGHHLYTSPTGVYIESKTLQIGQRNDGKIARDYLVFKDMCVFMI